MLPELVERFCLQFGVEAVPIGKDKYRTECPFHIEDIPSFTIYVNTQTYYCFGCHRWGFLNELIGTEPDLQLRLNHALEERNPSIEFGFALACLRVKDKTQIWDVMQKFDDEKDPKKKTEIFENFLEST